MSIRIETIDDVLPHIPDGVGIIVSRRPDLQVIDYVFTNDDTFSNPVTLECRGLKFAADGRILARPFHKFFNVGEKEMPEAVDWSRPHVVLDKLDGSMVHPCVVGDRLAFMTRMGESAQAKAAFAGASPGAIALCRDLLAGGITPIFEFTSPDNRIVVPYDTTALTLIGARETVSGHYLPHGELEALSRRYDVALVQSFGAVGDFKTFIAGARALEGAEGYVVAFEDGHRLKLKADAYVLRHKALAGVAYEKNLLEWVAADAVDDVLPLLSQQVGARVAAYRDQVHTGVERRLAEITQVFEAHRDRPRREYAEAVRAVLDKRLHSVAFALLDGRDGRAALVKMLTWASKSEPRIDTVRDLFGLSWEGQDLVVEPV